MSHRQEKLGALMKQKAGQFFNDQVQVGVLVTVTGADVSSDGRYATISMTVYPDHEMESVVKQMEKKRGQLGDYLKSTTKLKRIPYLRIRPDTGEKRRQRIETLYQEKE